MRGALRPLQTCLLAGALTLPADVAAAAEPASASTESSDDAADGSFRTRSPYLHVAPFGIGSNGEPALFWGLGGGIMLPRGRRALVTVGGFAEHVLFLDDRLFPGERQIQLFRAGPEVRIGGGRRVFGYGLLRLGLELLIWRERPEPAAVTTIGAGVQALPSKRILMGAELGADASYYGVNGISLMGRVRVFVGVKF